MPARTKTGKIKKGHLPQGLRNWIAKHRRGRKRR